MEIKNMDLPTRRRLIQLACVAAWSDMNLADVEKEVVLNLARELELGEDDTQRVKSWLANGPPDFDPYDIPLAHRQAFRQEFQRFKQFRLLQPGAERHAGLGGEYP